MKTLTENDSSDMEYVQLKFDAMKVNFGTIPIIQSSALFSFDFLFCFI